MYYICFAGSVCDANNCIFLQGFPLKSKPVRLNVLVPPSTPVISVGSYYGQVLDDNDGVEVDAKKRNRRGRIQEDIIPVEIG